MDLENCAQELEVAVKAVHMACLLCSRVQESLILESNLQLQSQDDGDSPVAVADWSVQALVSWVLSESFGSKNVSIVAEEDVEPLSKTSSISLLNLVTKTVNESLTQAPTFGISPPSTPLTTSDLLEAIRRCKSSGGPTGLRRFWVLNPLDGTLGFASCDQYAVSLALIEDGEPVLGVIGCPNYPMKREWLSYQNGYRRIVSRLMSAASWGGGCLIYAGKGSGVAWMQPLLRKEQEFVWPNSARRIEVSAIDDPLVATFCEPTERANLSHSFTEGLAHSAGLRNQPLRIHSMLKYAAIARGDAQVFMKFARAGYKEKITSHAAGVVIIREGGGVVSDIGGRPLCFSRGKFLEGLDRGVIASCGGSLHEEIIKGVDDSWNSSCL